MIEHVTFLAGVNFVLPSTSLLFPRLRLCRFNPTFQHPVRAFGYCRLADRGGHEWRQGLTRPAKASAPEVCGGDFPTASHYWPDPQRL